MNFSNDLIVSIPSRRVGDDGECVYPEQAYERFHPLKAGRRLDLLESIANQLLQFPSPQGGSETFKRCSANSTNAGFHPLKAGRRRPIRCAHYSLPRVSIPSRRVGDATSFVQAQQRKFCFHPLKAGRRHPCHRPRPKRAGVFPSPQGGSETSLE